VPQGQWTYLSNLKKPKTLFGGLYFQVTKRTGLRLEGFGRVYFQVTKRTAFEVRSFLPHRGWWQSHVSWRGTGIHPGDKPDVCSLYNKIGTSI
jgi:hypothetical protein